MAYEIIPKYNWVVYIIPYIPYTTWVFFIAHLKATTIMDQLPQCFEVWIKDRVFTHTVDGKNHAPPGMYITLWILGYLLHQLVQDFFHQQYYILAMNEWWLMHTMKNLFRQMDYLHQTRVKPIASLKTPSRCLVWYDSPCIYECCIAHVLYELHTSQ